MPLKVGRDVKSFQVEASFLGSKACAALEGVGVAVARAYAVQMEPCEEDLIESKFAMLLHVRAE
eukprot:CAMPEP_0114147678 /NCGR_PEP_ID=MMETSP0043_2-20121206/21228_1 /TAXON_ID=464988 /ORGANISM="Hemiselmis andersenii, Strain CCMP644" /LENGTH=63 /DNA_ID=CAMNT_0001242219 /DNA_START=11 /DNA_END=202 /DNA_ORIENTATION=+